MRLWIVLVAGLFTACSHHGSVDTLRTRAAFDMSCPADHLTVTELDHVTEGVEGCGKRGTYVWDPQQMTWILNTDRHSVPPPPSGGGAAPGSP